MASHPLDGRARHCARWMGGVMVVVQRCRAWDRASHLLDETVALLVSQMGGGHCACGTPMRWDQLIVGVAPVRWMGGERLSHGGGDEWLDLQKFLPCLCVCVCAIVMSAQLCMRHIAKLPPWCNHVSLSTRRQTNHVPPLFVRQHGEKKISPHHCHHIRVPLSD